MNSSVRRAVSKRSRGRCEAFVLIGKYPARCSNRATEIHHMLTKARGGLNLDRVGEIYHLIHLCSECHRASDGGQAYEMGLLLEGSVAWDRLQDKPVYTGPDDVLAVKYGTEQNAPRPSTWASCFSSS